MIDMMSRALTVSALFASVALLGAAPASGSMYLRAPNLRMAPVVQSLDYDAVATVPARPHTPPSLLPVDRVEGNITLPADETNPAVDRSTFDGVSTFTVVQVNARGVVVERTVFAGVSVYAVDLIGTGDGNMVRRVRFGAAKVSVTGPGR
jgi:hypothetical protein